MLFRGLVFAAGLAAGAGAALAFAQNDKSLPACPERLVAGTSAEHCVCPSEATATGSVWGSDLYTDDSAICRAALHAGAIGTDGGAVYVIEAAGQPSYPAITRNSVASAAWPAWGRSIAFRNVSEATAADRVAAVAACPANAGGLAIGTRITCGCSAPASAAGPVWGSGPYTADSAICHAARHAGRTNGNGYEVVAIVVTAGRQGYAPSTRHRVAAGSWGAFSSSFEFQDPR
jgi:hypothetical protein